MSMLRKRSDNKDFNRMIFYPRHLRMIVLASS